MDDRTVKTKRMKMISVSRVAVFFLSLSLSLPQSAFALRQANLEGLDGQLAVAPSHISDSFRIKQFLESRTGLEELKAVFGREQPFVTSGLEEPTPDELREYLEANQYPDGAIRMIVDKFHQGTHVVVLSDPHPLVARSSSYADFLEALIKTLIQEGLLKKVFIETGPPFVKEDVIPFLQDWLVSPRKDLGLRSYIKYLRTNPEVNAEAWARGTLIEEKFNAASHWFPALRIVARQGIPIAGFDPRWRNYVSTIKKIDEFSGAEDILKEEMFSLPSEGGVTEQLMTLGVLNQANPIGGNLVIAGTLHSTKTEGLHRMGGLLSRTHGLKVSVVLVEIGWKAEYIPDLASAWPLLRLLRETDLPAVTVKQILPPLAPLVYGHSFDIVPEGIGSIPEQSLRIPILAGDFDSLVYFRTEKDVADYLEKSTGLEERITHHRVSIQDQLQIVLQDLTQNGFTYQIVDQNLVKDYPGLAVLSELHPGVWIDRSENQQQTNQLVVDLVSRGVRWVNHYGESDRASRFRKSAQRALIDVRVAKATELELLKQVLANLSGLNDPDLLEARLERMGLTLQRIASWLDHLA